MTVTPFDADRANSIVNLMDEVLKRLVDGYEAAGVDLPGRRYWKMGNATHDCEQAVVSFVQCYFGPPGDEASEPVRCDGPRTAVLDIEIVRCIPTPKGQRGIMPTGEEIQDKAVPQAVDAYLLLDLAQGMDQWDGMAPGFGLGVIATVDAGEGQGGFQGTVLHLTLAIP